MKVKVRRIAAPYQDVPTESLQAICRNHAHDKLHVRVSVEQLYDIMDELARRRQESGADPFRSNEEAWAEFVKYYMPKDPDSLIDPTWATVSIPASNAAATSAIIIWPASQWRKPHEKQRPY